MIYFKILIMAIAFALITTLIAVLCNYLYDIAKNKGWLPKSPNTKNLILIFIVITCLGPILFLLQPILYDALKEAFTTANPTPAPTSNTSVPTPTPTSTHTPTPTSTPTSTPDPALSTKSLEELYLEAESAWKIDKRSKTAIYILDQILSRDSSFYKAIILNGRIYMALESDSDLLKATQQFSDAIKLDPNRYDGYYFLSLAYYQTKSDPLHIDRAIEMIKEAIDIRREAPALKLRGVFYVEKGDYDAAIADLKEALEINNKYTAVHFFLGRAYYQLGEWQNAANSYKSFECETNIDSEVDNIKKTRLEDALAALRKHTLYPRPITCE